MKLALSLAGLMLAMPAYAQAPAAAATPAPATSHGRTSLDANHDGAIDRTEAAARAGFAKRFDTLDRNKDGRLTADERPQRGERGMRGDRRGMQGMDKDSDGRISKAEFDAAGAARAATPGKDRHARPDFAALDQNHDGFADRTELGAYRERMRPQREAERSKRMEEHFARTDANHDGRLAQGEVSGRLAEHFASLDANHDGFLSHDELKAQHRRR